MALVRRCSRLILVAVLSSQLVRVAASGELSVIAQWLTSCDRDPQIAAVVAPGVPGSVVIYSEPSLWTEYRWYVLGVLSFIVVQTMLIAGLLIQRSRRRQAEHSARATEAALRLSYERIRQLAGRLIGAQETARTRIARDLHDDVCQELASLSMAVGEVKERAGSVGDSETRNGLSEIQQRTQHLVEGVRRLSHDLHPGMLRHVGLAAALEAHCVEVEQRYDVQVGLDADSEVRELRGDIALALFRIVQEALRNAATHGDARRVTVSIRQTDESIELVVHDDGRGFDRDEVRRRRGEGLGFVSMEERARLVDGKLLVTSAPGRGTTIRALVRRRGPGRTATTVTRRSGLDRRALLATLEHGRSS
jgi:signal transduction histidine kinase